MTILVQRPKLNRLMLLMVSVSAWCAISLPTLAQNSFTPKKWTLEMQPGQSHHTPEQLYSTFRTIVDQGRPRNYQLYSLTDPKKIERATLLVSNKGSATVNEKAFCTGSKKITFQNAKERFGEPRQYGQVSIFDLVGEFFKEPNVFHLEITFDKRNIAEKYRVRGHGIIPGDFITIECVPQKK